MRGSSAATAAAGRAADGPGARTAGGLSAEPQPLKCNRTCTPASHNVPAIADDLRPRPRVDLHTMLATFPEDDLGTTSRRLPLGSKWI